ncbi:MAG: DUF418 domain-containing protein [Sphingomonadales bacterium]|nr:DUF418 domain-containing protein [Sphingomonadales bacterium]
MEPASAPRIAALDLVRGVAVLGILAINIAGFAGPSAATDTPWLPHRPTPGDETEFAIVFLLFEGKMRAIFSMLFGASMLLFVEQAEATRRDGELLQLRRLFWLGIFGYLHYLLLWWGDILFVYAVAGALALPLRRLSDRSLVLLALAIFVLWHGWGMLDSLAPAAPPAQRLAAMLGRMHGEMAEARLGFRPMIAHKLASAPEWPMVMTAYTLGETLPLMLIGMVLLRSGFFSGRWPRRRLAAIAVAGFGLGGALNLAELDWAWRRHFPAATMPDLLAYWAAPAHLLIALAYASALMLGARRLLASGIGRRIEATGRVALSNYLGTSLVMCAIFYGWGLGLFDHVAPAHQPLFVLGAWIVMLGWSPAWLARFRQGPLEWLWRSLTELRPMPMRRRTPQ